MSILFLDIDGMGPQPGKQLALWAEFEGPRRRRSFGVPKSAAHCANISRGLKGKSKPWQRGALNPNFGNKAAGTPEARRRFADGVRARGQSWTVEHRKQHSELMSGPSNAMRGTTHTPESIAKISLAKRQQYRDGTVRFSSDKISKPERALASFLLDRGYSFKQQFHIPGEPYWYDFKFHEANLILEFQGDYWHANPEKHKSGALLRIQSAGPILVDAIWARDAAKRVAAEKHGLKVVYFWEADFNRHGVESVLGIIGNTGRA